MTIPGSITKGAKLWIFNALTAALTPSPSDSLLVSYDEPGPNQPDDIVAVSAVDRVLTRAGMVGSLGAGAFQDTVTVHVVVSVFRGGDNAQMVFERACDLIDAVIAVIRTDPTLGGIALSAVPRSFAVGEAAWEDENKGRVSETDIPIECIALI